MLSALRRSLALVAVLAVVGVGCVAPSPAASPSSAGSPSSNSGIAGVAVAGPVCPVERVPPDPSCAARPVAGAVLLIRNPTGTEIARVVTGADGTYRASLPPGDYTIEPQPVEGLMGTPGPEHATVAPDAVSSLDFIYDTGIRGPVQAPS